jgi:hypothetical protein
MIFKKNTYDSLVNCLDGGQERIQYPNRLATQLKHSYELNDLLDSEGKGWFEENKAHMRNFTEQQVKEIVIKANLQPGQTLQRERMADMVTPKPRQPRGTRRHESDCHTHQHNTQIDMLKSIIWLIRI